MNLNEYCQKANRTNADLDNNQLNNLHMVLGMTTEIGEFADIFKKNLAYNKELDWTNIKEEIGDIMWYIGNFCFMNHIDMEDILTTNIAKLESRYPEKFSQYHATHRDLEKERKILES